MRKILNWAGTGLVAVIGIGVGWASLLFLISPMFHSSEPGFAQGLIPYGSGLDLEVDRRLTAALEQKFPAGTKEIQLKTILYLQGFRSVLPLLAICEPRELLPFSERSALCDDWLNNTLKYSWDTDIGCRPAITVKWTTNRQAEVTTVNGYYQGGCR